MSESDQADREVEALWRRWRRSFGWAFIGLTAAILAVFALVGDKDTEPLRLVDWAKIAAIYAILIGYSAVQWRAARRALLAGKSEDEAMRARL